MGITTSLTKTCCERKELNRRGLAAVVVSCKGNGRGFDADVYHGRTSQGFGLLVEAQQHLATTIVKDNIVGVKTAAEQTLEPHEEDLTPRWTDADAHMEQRRRICGH